MDTVTFLYGSIAVIDSWCVYIYTHVACLACDCNGCLKVSYPSSDTNNKKNDAFISIRMGIIQMKTIEPTYLSQMCGKIIGI